LFRLIQQYPQFRFYPKSEVSLVTEIYLDEMDDGEGDSATRIRARARVDVIVEAERFFSRSERVIMLLLGHKQLEMLRRSDWTAGLYDGSFQLHFNAKIIAEQSRKYVCAAMFHVIGVFDSTALVGMCLRNAHKDLRKTSRTLPVKSFLRRSPGEVSVYSR